MCVQRRKYEHKFKRNGVRLTKDAGRTVKEVSANLGILKDHLYKWRRELCLRDCLAFPGHGREAFTDPEKRIKELERKLKNAEMERDV